MSKGDRIREMRKKRGFSASQLGRMIGKDRATVYRYENGSFEKIDAETMRALSRALGTSVEYLIGDTDDPAPGIWEKPLREAPLVLSDEERQLIRKLRALAPEDRERLLEAVNFHFSILLRKIEEGSDDAGI